MRLRFINAAALTYFNLRIPGLPMTVVQADGQHVEPVTVDELQMAVAETFDVIVEPIEGRAYPVFAESMDRTGYALGTLAPREGMTAAVPALREPPLRTMVDMGMAIDQSDATGGMNMREMHMPMADGHGMEGMAAAGPVVARHGPDSHGPGNTDVAEVQRNRLGEPGYRAPGRRASGAPLHRSSSAHALQPTVARPRDRAAPDR